MVMLYNQNKSCHFYFLFFLIQFFVSFFVIRFYLYLIKKEKKERLYDLDHTNYILQIEKKK